MENVANVRNIPTENLYHNPNNPRRETNYGDISELCMSIKAMGILQNLTVCPYDPAIHAGLTVADPDNSFVVLIGNRRLEGGKAAKLEALPCVVHEGLDAAKQLEIMIVENCQRQDLTLQEEAESFKQLSLFGKTVAEIAKMTGFSQSKIRDRIKLTSLDSEKVQQAAARGATLSDYAKVYAIKDTALQNEVLDSIGTVNFEYTLKRCKDKDKNQIRGAEIVEKLKEFAVEVDSKLDSYTSVATYYKSDKKEIEVPGDADTVSYFFVVDYAYITVYRERTAAETQEIEDRKTTREKYANDVAELKVISNRMKELRQEFMKRLTQTTCKKHLANIAVFLMEKLHDYSSGYNSVGKSDWDQAYHKYLGLALDETKFCDRMEWETAVKDQPEYAMAVAAYFAAETKAGRFFRDDYYPKVGHYVPRHQENTNLEDLYCFLEELGYQCSDEEQAIRRGTHTLFYVEPAEEPATAENAQVEGTEGEYTAA